MTQGSTMAISSTKEFIGLDLSDKTATFVVVSLEGEVVQNGKLKLTQMGLNRAFAMRMPAAIAIEVGGHSPWVSRVLTDLGHEVTVANPRHVKLISNGPRKNDRIDAENLARLLRFDPLMLHEVHHRSVTAQSDLSRLRGRDSMVRARTQLINSARGIVKADGGRLPRCSADSFDHKVRAYVPELLRPTIEPMLDAIASLTDQILTMNRQLEKLADERYPETRVLRQIKGVGVLTSLGFVLTLQESQRFAKSRSVGAFVGLTARQYDSGESQPQLRITKAGDPFLRRLLVQSAQYILGPFGDDCDLRRWGFKLMRDANNKILKRKAIIAVARKLAVLLHRLWSTAEVYEPFHQANLQKEVA